MKALVTMTPDNYNPRDYIPTTFIAQVQRKLWRNHFLWAILIEYQGKPLCIWAPDFTLIDN